MSDYKYHRCMLFKDSEGASQRWRLLNVSFGELETCDAKEVGYIDERLLGLAVFSEVGEFQKLVSVGDFSAALSILGIDDYLMVSNSHTEFLNWLMDRDSEYWEASESTESVIYDFLNDVRGDILSDEKINDSRVQRLIKDFDQDISSRIDEVDENKAHSWPSLVYGWALAKGLDVYSAQDFVSRVHDCRWDKKANRHE